MEVIRSGILFLGWPILIYGSAFVFYRSYQFYREVGKNVWGKLVLTMVIGWLITMYSLGIVSTWFMLVALEQGTAIVLPVFMTWFFTMILIIRTVFRWNTEAVQVNRFNLQLQTLVAEKTRDLLHEKQMAEAERNKLDVVIASITDGILALDLDRKITVINPAVEQMTGYTREELVGCFVLDKLSFWENGRQLGKEDICQIRTDGFEGVLIHKGLVRITGKGRETNISLTVSQIREGSIANVGCIITIHDKSKDQELEEMKLDFVSMAAHELRTPLTAVRSYASLLHDRYAQELNIEGKMYIDRLALSSEMLGALIDNLLQVSRIEHNTFKIDLAPVAIVPIIQNIITSVSAEAQSRRQTISFVPPEQSFPPVMADGFRIGQVITNLLANAMHYTADEGAITVTLRQLSGFAEVTVADTGQGIPSDALPKLFTKFFRLSGALGQGAKGTGLGLYIVKSIIDMHKGTVTVESEVGKGTTFRVLLPLATAEDIAKQQSPTTDKIRQGAVHPIILNATHLLQKMH